MKETISMALVRYSAFVETVQCLLNKGDIDEANKLIYDENNFKCIEENIWDLIEVIAQFVNSEVEKSNSRIFYCSVELLTCIGTKFNPKETLFQLLLEINECEDDVKFLTLLQPIRKTLMRTPQKSWPWTFSDISKYLKKCRPPAEENLHGKEKLLYDTTQEYHRILQLYGGVVDFYEPFTKDLSVASYELNSHTAVMRTFLIQLLGKPLMYLDMEIFDNVKNRGRSFAELLVHQIFKTTNDLIPLADYRTYKNYVSIIELDAFGLANLMYLVYSEKVLFDRLPVIYDPIYCFQNLLNLITVLLEFNSSIVIEKGLKFATSFLERVKMYMFPSTLLDSEDHCHFCKVISSVIIYNENEALRKSALEVYKSYLCSFDDRGFYLLIYNLMTSLSHSGLISFTISIYKDRMVSNFEKGMSKYFRGDKLFQLLQKFCHLQKNEESDMVELHDQIIASLNFLRYLSIKDIGNVTNIWEHFRYFEETYFKYLRKGIELSKAHYELVVKELMEKETGGGSLNTVDISVTGQSLAHMNTDEKLGALRGFLTMFDMMEYLLSRVEECIEVHKQK